MLLRKSLATLLQKTVLFLGAIALLSQFGSAQLFQVTNLTSDIPNVGSAPTDPDLVNPWGLVPNPTGFWWVSDNHTGKSTLYDLAGIKQSLIVDIPQWDGSPGGNPDGIVFNSTTDFEIVPGKPGIFLFSTEDGTIQAWNPQVARNSTEIMFNGWPDAEYKGMALGVAGGANYIYAANFKAGTVDVFDAHYQPHSFGSGAFTDNTIPVGYAPFNVFNVNGNIVVSYALPDDDKEDDVPGPGHGYLRVYDSQGNLLQRLPHVFQLNSPWGMAVAPSNWGTFSGKLLVGQFGSGAIAAFDLAKNTFVGVLQDTDGLPIRINGLWGLSYGNGGQAGPTDTLFFAAGYFGEEHGMFGSIAVGTKIFSTSGATGSQVLRK